MCKRKAGNNDDVHRIAQVIRKLDDGGIESVVYNYYRAIDRERIQFDVIYQSDSVADPSIELKNMGMNFYKVTPYYINPFKYVSELVNIFKSNKYLIVHSNMNTISVFVLYSAFVARIPIRICHNHSVPGGKEHHRNIFKYILRIFSTVFATDYFACSKKAAIWMFGKKATDEGKVRIIHNAIDFKKYSKEKRNYDTDELIIGTVGRLTYAKNYFFLIDVFCLLLDIYPNSKLLIVGDGELKNELITYCEKLRVNSKVIFTGWKKDTENYYNKMSVFVMPSIFEGLSMATIEAQASGVPCVVSEAIPEEAVISDCCIRTRLEEDKNIWVKRIIDVASRKVNLNTNATNYDISLQAEHLQKWYLDRIAQEQV